MIWTLPSKRVEKEASSSPAAQPMKPKPWRVIRLILSASSTAATIPISSSKSMSAAPLAASMSLWMRSLRLRAWTGSWPREAARMVGVKMPMP